MEVAPFFVDVHHFLSIFTIFYRFSPFFIDFHDLRTFVAIYILSRFTHFFRKFFLAKIAFPATSHVFCMYAPRPVPPPPPSSPSPLSSPSPPPSFSHHYHHHSLCLRIACRQMRQVAEDLLMEGNGHLSLDNCSSSSSHHY